MKMRKNIVSSSFGIKSNCYGYDALAFVTLESKKPIKAEKVI